MNIAKGPLNADDRKLVRSGTILENLKNDRDINETCDVVIMVENESINAHKSILIACSPYFRAMLCGAFKEREGYVEIGDISKKDFKWLLDFMYGAEMDFASKAVEEIESALDLADMLCLDMFKRECEEFVAKWRQYDHPGMSYFLAKKLNLANFESEVRLPVMHQLVPLRFLTVDKINVDFKTVSFDLIFDALKHLKSVSESDSYEMCHVNEMNTVASLKTRLEGVVTWMTLHPNHEMTDYLDLLDLAKMECVPGFEVGEAFTNVLKVFPNESFETAANAVNIKMAKVSDSISALKVRLTLVVAKGLTVNIADFDHKNHKWSEMTFHVGIEVVHSVAEGNMVFLIGRNDLFTYDMENKKLSERHKLSLKDEQFEVLRVYAKGNLLYLYGKNIESNNVIIGTLNVNTKDWSRRELTLQFQTDLSPSLSVCNSDDVIFNNGYFFYKYNRTSNVLNQICCVNRYFPNDLSKLCMAGEDMFVFQSNGTYIKNPSPRNYEPVYTETHAMDYQVCSICSSGNYLVVALYVSTFEDHIKLMLGDRSQFNCLAFLPPHNLVGVKNVNLVLRQEIKDDT